jgi:hypothetical protein
MSEIDTMLKAFRAAYHDRDYYPDTEEADDWWCEKLGTWKRAWDAATASAYEACAKVAEDYFSPATWRYAEDQPYTIGREIAAAIRARSCSLETEDEQRD